MGRPRREKAQQTMLFEAARRRPSLSPTRPVTPEVAGSSPVAPVKRPCKTAYFVVTFENPIGRSGSKRSERNPRGAAVGAEADANLPGF